MKKVQLIIIVVLVSLLGGCVKNVNKDATETDIGVDFSRLTVSKTRATSIELAGEIHNNNQALDEAGIYIDLGREFTNLDADITYKIEGALAPSSEAIKITIPVLNLRSNTQYYAKFYARVSDKISYSNVISFKTSALSTTGDEVLYQLPIVFHIIYSNAADKNKNIPTSTLRTIVESCNEMFGNKYKDKSGKNSGIKLSFTPSNDMGIPLGTPGIDRIESAQSTYDINEFATQRSIIDKTWNPNKVINIWIYEFDKDNTNVIGQSNIAYATGSQPLAGLSNGDLYLSEVPNHYAHGIQMSNRYINNLQLFSEALTHEIGHYLGLYHTFSEKGCNLKNDYCDDTPSYDRSRYEGGGTVSNQFDRLDCSTGKVYKARNYMDYSAADFSEFSPDQIARMQHVLKYSPLVPGADRRRSRATKTDAPRPKARWM